MRIRKKKHPFVIIINILLISCCIFPLSTSTTHAADNTITEEEYWQEIEATLAAVRELLGNSPNIDEEVLEARAQYWENVSIVSLSEDEYVTIDTSFLVRMLRADPPDLAFLETHLQAQLDAYGESSAAGYPSNAEEILSTILEREEFTWKTAEKSKLEEFIDKILTKIGEFFSKLLPEGGVAFNIDLNLVLYVISAVLLGMVFYYVISQMRGSLIADAELIGMGEEAELITSEIAIARAQELSQAGDNRKAIRYLYLSALLFLEERKILRYDRTKTNREYMQNVAGHPEISADFNEVVETFDQVWYGFQEIDEEAFHSYQDHVNHLRDKA